MLKTSPKRGVLFYPNKSYIRGMDIDTLKKRQKQIDDLIKSVDRMHTGIIVHMIIHEYPINLN